MHNLRVIHFYKASEFLGIGSNVILPAYLECLPDELKILRWDGFHQRSLPLDFCPENLVILEMHDSHLEQLWEGDQVFQTLCLILLHFTDMKSLAYNLISVGLSAKN